MRGAMDRAPLERALLGAGDPAPVEEVNAESPAPLLLLCEHAGQAIPRRLGDLGLPPGAIDTHIGWDPGAERLARALAERLGAPLILQRYSRLVIDCNRPPDAPSAMPEEVEGIAIPGNRGLTASDRKQREAAIFAPMNRALEAAFARYPRRAAFSIHSFTPVFAGERRHWHAGFLTRRDLPTAELLRRSIARQEPDLVLAINEPYRIEDDGDWFIPAYAERRGLAHSLIEIRNDQLGDAAGIETWAARLTLAIAAVLEQRA